MLIVDAQVHIWKSGKPTNANHRQVPVFSKDDLLKEMDEAGVDAAVIHPPASGIPIPTSWPSRPRASIPTGSRSSATFRSIVRKPRADRRVEAAPGMLGLRFALLQPHQQTWPTDGTIDWLWPAAERAGMPVALLAAGLPAHGGRGRASGIRA